jgi:hypothetical protein
MWKLLGGSKAVLRMTVERVQGLSEHVLKAYPNSGDALA